MNFFYSLLGGVAQASGKMSRFSVNMIPSNWGLMGFCAIFSSICWSEFALKRDYSSLAGAIVLLAIAALFLVSSLLRHTIFQAVPAGAGASPHFDSAPVQPADEEGSALRFSGKLRLHEKHAQRFLAVPARLTKLEDGQLAFASNIDASSRMYGAVVQNRTGIWLSVPRPGSIETQTGLFYHGFKPAPALRMNYIDDLDGKKAQAILAFDSLAVRDAVQKSFASAQSNGNITSSGPFTTSTS